MSDVHVTATTTDENGEPVDLGSWTTTATGEHIPDEPKADESTHGNAETHHVHDANCVREDVPDEVKDAAAQLLNLLDGIADEVTRMDKASQQEHADHAAMSLLEAVMFVDEKRSNQLIDHIITDRLLSGLVIFRLVENILQTMQRTHPELDALTKADPSNKKAIGEAYAAAWNVLFAKDKAQREAQEDVQE